MAFTTILSDFSRVVLHPRDKNYKGTLNGLYKDLLQSGRSFNFFDYFEFNDDILNLYSQLKPHVSINLYTTGTIQNSKEVRKRIDPIFDNIFSSEELGLDKKEPNSYEVIASRLQVPVNHILYIDDQQENIEAARKAGLETWLYSDFLQLQRQINQALGIGNS